MGSISDIFTIFLNAFEGFVSTGSDAANGFVDTGSAAANGVFGEITGSLGDITA